MIKKLFSTFTDDLGRCSLRHILSDGGTKNADIFERTVEIIGLGLLDALNDIEALSDFAKDGVLSIEMGRATNGRIDLNHFRRQLYTSMCHGVKSLLCLFYLSTAKALAPHDIELAGRAAHLRIDSIRLACHSHTATTMDNLRQTEFWLLSIVEIASTQLLSRLRVLTVRVA